MLQTDALLVEWLRAEGDQVAAGEPVAVIQTDKADVEVEAPARGRLYALALAPGQSAAVGTVIAYVLAPGEPAPPPAAPAGTPVAAKEEAGGSGEIKASPGARRLARELGVDLAAVEPSGPGGRITEQDVRGSAGGAATEAERPLSRARRITAE